MASKRNSQVSDPKVKTGKIVSINLALNGGRRRSITTNSGR